MKKISLSFFILILTQLTFSQSISSFVTPASGDFFIGSKGSLSWTMGETFTELLTSPNNKLSQGFQQPPINCSPLSLTPSSITQTLVSNVCGAKVYRYTAALTSNAIGYMWTLPPSVGGVTGVVLDSGFINNSRVIKVLYSSNLAAIPGDSIWVRSYNTCGYSANKSAKLTNSLLTTPTPASVTIASVQTNVCNARIYRYTAPEFPAATATAATATGYLWIMPIGLVGATGSLDSGTLTSKVIRIIYSSNAAAGVSDSIKVAYTFSCGAGPAKAAKLTNSLLTTPIPASVSITSVQTNVCNARIYRYTAPEFPAATATAPVPTGYLWSMPIGLVGATGSLDSGSLTSKVIRIIYSSNAAAGVGDSIKVAYTSSCGISPAKAAKLTNSLLTTPIPASVTITSVQTNVCNVRIYRYTAPVFPAATATAPAPIGYLWTIPPIGSVGATGSLDSGTITGRIIRIRYTSNNLASAGDTVKVAYTSTCGVGLPKATKLTNTATIAPAAPTAITMQLVSDVCGARVYRYIAPNLTAATATAIAPNGWEWTWVGLLASTAVIDSGTLSSQKIKLRFAYNTAAAIGDSMKIRFTTPCTTPSLFKAVKFSNLLNATCRSALIAKLITPVTNEVTYRKLDATISPNPSMDWFQVSVQTISEEPITIRVFDMQGKVLKQMVYPTGKEFKIKASWIPGVYLLEIMQSKQVILKKLIKQ